MRARPSTFNLTLPEGGARAVRLAGRAAWAADQLIAAGGRGLTAADCPPGTRLAAFVHKLTAAGIPIQRKLERHGGEFAGRHARYSLAPGVTLTRT